MNSHIIDFIFRHNYQTIHTNQGYSRCNLCIVNENAVITEDNPKGDVVFTLTETKKTVKGTYKSKAETTGLTGDEAKYNGWQYFCEWVVE